MATESYKRNDLRIEQEKVQRLTIRVVDFDTDEEIKTIEYDNHSQYLAEFSNIRENGWQIMRERTDTILMVRRPADLFGGGN